MTSQLNLVIAGCVLQRDGKYLLVQEKKPIAYGKWGLPAGRVNADESIEHAAVREVFEESGFVVEIEAAVRSDYDAASGTALHSFRAKILSGSLHFPQDELLDARWLTAEEIEALYEQGKIRADWVIHSIRDVHQLAA